MGELTPSQTVGPYFRIGLNWETANRLVDEATPGEHIVVTGRVLDGDGEPVREAMIEIWQADAEGRYPGPGQASEPTSGFGGFGRCGVGEDGGWVFETVKPGAPVDDEEVSQAPHINVAVFARGLLTHLYTRIYFEEETDANATDAVMQRVPEDRRATLLARREGDHYVFDIRLQGEKETVFLDV